MELPIFRSIQPIDMLIWQELRVHVLVRLKCGVFRGKKHMIYRGGTTKLKHLRAKNGSQSIVVQSSHCENKEGGWRARCLDRRSRHFVQQDVASEPPRRSCMPQVGWIYNWTGKLLWRRWISNLAKKWNATRDSFWPSLACTQPTTVQV